MFYKGTLSALLSIIVITNGAWSVSPKPGLFDKGGYCAKTAAWMPRTQLGVDVPEPRKAPVTGSFRAIVLLVEFSDRRADKENHSQGAFRTLLFDSTGVVVTGSMHEYFQEVSYGRLFLWGEVSVWMEAPQTNSYYADDQFGQGRWPRNRVRLAYDVVAAADQYVDFSQYDGDGDGIVDALFIVHAGAGGEETGKTNDLWSHKGTLPAHSNGTGSGYGTDDGVTVGPYTMQPEEHEDEGLISIGVFCHEFGHVLGLPDLYDRDNSIAGIGNWGLMGGGSWGGDGRSPETPVHLCAWSKERVGWIAPIAMTQNVRDQTIRRVEDHNDVYKLWAQGMPATEYFLIENRQPVGFDSEIPSGGLLIWHIDNSVTTQNDNEFDKLVDLEAADGARDLDRGTNRGDAGDPFPGAAENVAFHLFSQPNSRTKGGAPSQVSVLNIGTSHESMRADLQVTAEVPLFSLKDMTVIDTRGNANGRADPGEDVDFVIALENFGREASGLRGKVMTTDQHLEILLDDVPFHDLPFNATGTNGSNPFEFSIATSADLHYAYFTLNLWEEGHTDTAEILFRLVIGQPDVLLVDDDYDSGDGLWVFDVEAYYRGALDSVGVVHDSWTWAEKGAPDAAHLKTYDIVIWFTGHATPSLSQEDIHNLTSFLDSGGGLFLSGQDVGVGLQSLPFLSDYLHAQFIENNSNEGFIAAVPEDPLSGDIPGLLVLSGNDAANNQPSPDVITPLSGATPVFEYTPSGRTAALKYAGAYRVVYFAFGFEALSGLGPDSRSIREHLMAGIIDWLRAGATEIEDTHADIPPPHDYSLSQNYPNPFNATTTIRYTLPGGEWKTEYGERRTLYHTTLTIYNTLGQKVRTLVNEEKEQGEYTMKWDGSDKDGREVSSGIYFYRLETGPFSKTKRLLLLK
ncbi:MAG: M6 family metalloprotease domain-containing protein [Gemmatimonadota bacterium]|nr:MAG: M6 family metalloprotease domain-containing protein [Gemmatimonadota bacterium]